MWLLANDYVSVTPLHADMTRYETFAQMQDWLDGDIEPRWKGGF